MAEILHFEDIYSWQSDNDRTVFVDSRNSFLIYQNASDKTVRIIDAKNGNCIFSTNKFGKPVCESILVSSDRNFILYWYNDPVTIGIYNILNTDSVDVLLEPSHYEDSIVFKVFWSDSHNSANSNFVVISNSRVDIYNFSFESSVLRTITKKSVSCVDAWNDLSGNYFILLHHNKSLYPYNIKNNEISQLAEIGLSLPYGHQLQHYEICVVTLYDDTYCIYKDVTKGTLSLRSLTNNKLHDKVLEVNSQGWLEICVIDNLMLVLTGSATCYIFDIAIKNDFLIATVPQKKPPISTISSDIESFIPSILVDFYGGFAHYITLDFNTLSLYLSRRFTEAMAAEFFQRRINCSDRVMEIVNSSIDNRLQMSELLLLFSTVLDPYAQTLRTLNKMKGTMFKGSAIPFNLIDKFIGNKSIITEHNFTASALYAFVIKEWRIRYGFNLFDFSITLICYHKNYDLSELLKLKDSILSPQSCVDHYILKSQILSQTDENAIPDIQAYLLPEYLSSPVPLNGGSDMNVDGQFDAHEPMNFDLQNRHVPDMYYSRVTPYIVTVTLCYLKNLVLHSLNPSNLVLMFFFDICVLYNQLTLLVDMIRTRVIRDSNLICHRLFLLIQPLGDPNLKQLTFDMSKRLKLYNITIHILLMDKKYYKALLLIKRERLDYPISKILHSAADDVNEQKRRPYLWQLILSFIHVWTQEYHREPSRFCQPNLKNCEMWLPNL
ncbi:conserved hypothetical protein [Theileria orientalis strain Shintoku]|uniref:Mic1 domain-containing protein n=1 Tax=Theileria orientalis strain Shintoku TaxID=869250 RepID=J4DP01_THEOR|nr:conserved hypothetical protein [Theileria orientalis strain Shintoku]PVC50195.1 hypothetical protein MACL_00002468 [Theileria orientalis]BAM39849.1 conserved hypothetical protein [Theileria orientalis strain Shintoku]|eukprot:XP_009690150.1 conserved hypothetical protein [Theileria orientalis strain Shintoku]